MKNRLPHSALRLLPLVLATSLVACASGTPAAAPQAPAAAASVAPSATGPISPTGAAPAQAGKKAPAAPPAVVAASIQKSLTRVARPIADPAAGKSFKASQYWDYELGTPFEVEDTTITGLGDTDKDGRTEIKIVSDVKLPNGKMQAKLMLLGKYALTQVDDEAEHGFEDGDPSDSDEPTSDADAADDATGSTDDDAGADDPESDTDASGTAVDAGTDDTPDDGDDDTTAEAGDEDEVDLGDDEGEDFDFDDWETEIDLAELDEAISEAEDDITWADDWLVDADGDGEWEEGDAEAYAEEFSEEEEDQFLTAPHKCEMTIQDADGMSNDDDLVTVTDKDTGETLTITYDQEWAHFNIKTSAGEGKVEYMPDGTYLLDGKPVGDIQALADRLREQAYFRVTSRYTLGLLAGRLGRLEQGGTRGAAVDGGGATSYRLAGATVESDARRSFAIVNALVAAAPSP